MARNITFEDIWINGKKLKGLDYFLMNEFVENVVVK